VAIKYITEAEKRADEARKKYGAMTISEILSRIIIKLLISFFIIIFACVYLFFSPVSDRMLAAVLLVFVLAEMVTEYALWAFTYQGMRKTEAPLADLQQFSVITKEGWRRAEMVLDWTAPFFKWADDLFKRSGMDWRNKKDVPKDEEPVVVSKPTPSVDYLQVISEFTRAMHDMTEKIAKLEQAQKQTQSQKPPSDELKKE